MRPFQFGAALVHLLAFASYSTQSPLEKRTSSVGCGKAPNTKKHQSFQSSGGLRHFLVDLPKNYDPKKPSPVVISYHGRNSDDDDQEDIDNFNESPYNDDLQAILIYPDGVEGSGGGLAWESAPYAKPGVSDVGFTGDLLNYIRSGYCIDNSRIYAAGRSNGGGFVDLLACSPVGSQFAAFAMSAAALYNEAPGKPCHPGSLPAPILEIHGTDDSLIDPDGGTSHNENYPSIASWLKTWAQRNGCNTTPIITHTHGKQLTTFNCGGRTDLIQGYLIDGLSHAWPTLSNTYDAKVDGSKVFMDFFKNHSK